MEEELHFVKKEFETILERDVLPVTIPEFGMNSPMVVPSIHATEAVEQGQKTFTHSWDPLFIG